MARNSVAGAKRRIVLWRCKAIDGICSIHLTRPRYEAGFDEGMEVVLGPVKVTTWAPAEIFKTYLMHLETGVRGYTPSLPSDVRRVGNDLYARFSSKAVAYALIDAWAGANLPAYRGVKIGTSSEASARTDTPARYNAVASGSGGQGQNQNRKHRGGGGGGGKHFSRPGRS